MHKNRQVVAERRLLRRTDQLVVGVSVAGALLGMAVYWFTGGGHRGRLVEIDRATPLRAAFLVDVNKADWPELTQLPGIGETLARRIVVSRRQEGPFLGHQELLRVNGIGPRTLDRIQPYLLPVPGAANIAGQFSRPDSRRSAGGVQ